MHVDENTVDWLRFTLTPNVKYSEALRLLQALGSPGAALRSSAGTLRNLVSATAAESFATAPSEPLIERTLAWLGENANGIIPLDAPNYPKALLQIGDPPMILYAKGRVDLLNCPCLAIVGSRNATAQGCANARSFAKSLSDAGLCIVSGLALGIDAAAHEGAMEGVSSTIAVAGTGLDVVYPARNRALAHTIAERGLLLSEFPIGTPARDFHFPKRNRLISGLARGVLVVEAAPRSGSLSTARFAGEQGREVFAIPGSIHSPLSRGCHALIKQGAKLVESAQDILDELGGSPIATSKISAPGPSSLPADGFLELMGYDPMDIDTLMSRSNMSVAELTAKLAALELEGLIALLPGGKYQRIF